MTDIKKVLFAVYQAAHLLESAAKDVEREAADMRETLEQNRQHASMDHNAYPRMVERHAEWQMTKKMAVMAGATEDQVNAIQAAHRDGENIFRVLDSICE